MSLAAADKRQPPEDGAKPGSLGTAAKLKALMSSLLSSGTTAGRPPAIHLPWNKARIKPGEVEGRGRLGEREGKEEAKRNTVAAGRREEDERIRIWRARAEMETWARIKAGGEEFRPEHRGELPGLVPNGGLVINRSYQRGSAETVQPPQKQKLNDTPGLISLNRRLQGPVRVGGEVRSNGMGRGGGRFRKMYDSVGDMSVSAFVSGRGSAAEGERWGRQVREEDSFSGEWHTKRKLFHEQRDPESEFSASDSNIPSSSVSTEREETESDTESQSKSGSQDEEEDSERESGSESDEHENSGGLRAVSRREVPERTKRGGRTSEPRKNMTEGTRYSSVSKPKPHCDASNEDQKERSPPQTIDLSDALSPIMEDTEEETSAETNY
ncbi:uncharacterized protein LOC144005295 [Festucalex cinctus]